MTSMEPLDAHNYAEYISRVFSARIDTPVLAFPEWPDAYNGFKKWSPRQIEVIADKAATYYVAQGLKVRHKGEPPLLIAIHAPGTLEWAATFFALLRMGHSVLVLSARLSDDVVTALLRTASCESVIHERALSLEKGMQLVPIVTSAGLLQDLPYQKGLTCDTSVIDPDVDTSQICHSSGSTGIPKLFPATHKEAMSNLRLMSYLANPKVAWLASALYNIVGLQMLMGCLGRGAPAYYDNDRLPFTTDGLIMVMKEIQPEEVFLTPYSLGLIASKPEGIEELKRSEMVANFGAVCPQALGDKTVREGVRFSSVYGISEVGKLLASSERTDDEWDWMLPVPWCEGHLDFRSIGEGNSAAHITGDQELYHLVILPTYKNIPSRFLNCNDPPGSFATGDLFLKHPQKPNRWKVVGRQDDQLKIYQGDRQSIVNALIYEDKIKRGNEDVLEEVVLFGQGRNKLGILIFAQNGKGSARELHSSCMGEHRSRDQLGAEDWY